MEEEQKKGEIAYKIMPDTKYRVFVTTHGEKRFYKIQVTQKNYDGIKSKWYKSISFRKGTEPIDTTGNGIDIIIKRAFETLRENPKDPYNPISTIMIMEYENPKREEEVQNEALNEFRDNLYENENETFDLPF